MPVAHQLFCSGADPLRHPRRPLHLSNKPRVAYLLNTRQQRRLLRHRSLPLRPHAATEASQSSASNPSGASPSALSSATEQLLAELRAGQPLQQSLGSVGRPLGPSAAAAGEAVSSAFEVTDAASASALGYYKQVVQQERLGMQQQLRQRQQQQQGSAWDWGDYEQMAREWREQQQQEGAAGYRQQQQAWQEHGQQQAPAVAGALPGTFVRPALHMPAGPAEHAAAASGTSMQSIAVPPPGSLSAAVPYPPDRGGGYPGSGASARFFLLGALAAVAANYMMGFVNTLPVVQYFVRRFIWWADPAPRGESATPGDTAALTVQGAGGALMQFSDDGESVEWVNMCWRKMWRVYQRGIERWLADLLQPLFDQLVREGVVPRFVQRLRILEFTLDHEAPYFTNMRRRTSRKDSDLTGVVDIRYTGGARMVLLIEVGFGKWRVKVPVLVSDLDLECKMWLKLRLAPLPPYIGAVSLGFLSPPMIKVQLSPYGKVQLMRIPIIQAFLRKFFTVQLPGLIVLPKRLDINIPPSTTAVAEAAIGRDAVMRAVASAVLQADALEHALMAALPLGPQGAAGGVSLPESFRGELSVTLHEAKELPVWGFPWQSNPYCRMSLGNQAVQSRRDVDTSHKGRHREPVWNQEFQFLVEDPATQTLEIWVRDSPVTGRREVGYATFPLRTLPQEGTLDLWLPVESSMPGDPNQGMIHLGLSYKSFADDEGDSGYREAQAFAKIMQEQAQGIVDVKSAADASSRAAVAASAAATAVAVTKAAAARAATRLAKTASRGRRASGSDGEGSEGSAASGSDSEGSDSDSNGSNGSSQPPAASSDSEGTQAAAAKEGSKGASGSGSKDGEGQGTASGTNGATNGTPAMGGVDLGTLAKAITQTLEKATLEEQQQLDRKRAAEGNGNGSGSGKEASSGAGAGAGVGADAGRDGDANGAGPKAETDSAALARLQEITSAMHDMKLEVDQLVYTPKRHKIHDGRLPPEEAAAGAAAEPPPNPSELFKAASEIAESAVAVAGAAAVAAAPAVDDLAAVPSGTDVRAVGAGVAPRQKWDPDAEPASEEEREKYKVEKMEKAVKKAVDAKATEAAQKVTALELGAGLDEVEGEAVAVVAQRPDGWRQRLAAWGAGLNSGGKSTKTKGRGQADDKKAKKAEEKARDKAVADAAAQEAVAGLPEPIAAVELADGPDGPVSNVVLPPDLPLDVIAEEVQRGWKNKEVHVEGLLKKAMEERQKEGEGRWLVVLTVTSGACAVLLSIVLYRMMHMQ